MRTIVIPRPRSAAHFDLASHWRLQAPRERVWSALATPLQWPRWWPSLRAVRKVRPGDERGVGGVHAFTWATRLGYELDVEIETIEVAPHARLRGIARGSLNGEGLWLLEPQGAFTDVTYLWRVQLDAGWKRTLAPLMAPVFRWSHQAVMEEGGRGLARELALR